MTSHIFPNIAGSVFGGVVTGLELARQRNERRIAARRQRGQDLGLADLQGQLGRVQLLNDDGSPREQRLIDADRETILFEASVNPAFDENTRNLIGTQARSLTGNRERVTSTTSAFSALAGPRGTDPAANITAPDLNLGSSPTPPLGAGVIAQQNVSSNSPVAQPVNEPAVITRSDLLRGTTQQPVQSPTPTQTTPATPAPTLQSPRDTGIINTQPASVVPADNGAITVTPVDNSNASVNRATLRSVADNVLDNVVASAQAASAAPETVAPAPPAVSNSIVTTLPDAVSQRVIDVANNLIQSGGFNISVQALVQLLEGRLRTLGVDVATLTEEQFDQLASNGQLLTSG